MKETGIAREAVGIEMDRGAAAAARKVLDRVVVGDIERIAPGFQNGYFDVVIMADVLEHLVDPWLAVKKAKRYLAKGGIFIASIPNIREYNSLFNIVIKGDFRYSDAGIMDRSHLRFFCRKNMLKMIGDVFRILEVRTVPELARGEAALFNRLTLRLFEEFLVLQYIIVACNESSRFDRNSAK
jgi:SAM-dependent methyltransferase